MRGALFGVIMVMAAGMYFLWTQNELNKALLLEEKVKTSNLQVALDETKNNLENQLVQLNDLTAKNQQYEVEMNEYLDIFRRHNLDRIASASPGQVTTRVNNATREVFDGIEADSQRISALND